jgi:hypothetical protein
MFYAVRYEAVNAMLLNAFLKEHHKVEEQETTVIQLKANLAKQEAIIAKQQTDSSQRSRIAARLQAIKIAGLQCATARRHSFSPDSGTQPFGNSRCFVTGKSRSLGRCAAIQRKTQNQANLLGGMAFASSFIMGRVLAEATSVS